ncbi:MAG: hypothetical protein JWP02_3563 [Acidimicrobiales bacterium]|nr:hypothetical protein [Acidimicrobiales bacterium]
MRRCAFCPPPVAPPVDPVADALWAPRIAACLAHADRPREDRPASVDLVSQHISRALRAGEEFAPWTPDGAAAFLARRAA